MHGMCRQHRSASGTKLYRLHLVVMFGGAAGLVQCTVQFIALCSLRHLLKLLLFASLA